jgi:hypothetical protein
MSYEMKSSPSLDCNLTFPLQSSSLRSSSSSSAFRTASNYSPVYSQCGDLFSSIKFLSRSLRRMNVDHALTGCSAVVMESGVAGPEMKSEIDLILSRQSYEHFLKSCVHQQVKPIEGEERAFWDNRTGCTVRIYVAGERLKIGRRSVEIPELNMMRLNDEGIKSWTVESKVKSKSVRETSRKLKVSAVPKVSPSPIAA